MRLKIHYTGKDYYENFIFENKNNRRKEAPMGNYSEYLVIKNRKNKF